MPGPNETHWTFGNRAHISFPNGGDPVAEPNHAFNTDEGCASISDSTGTLLFYTDGWDLFDASHTPIATGLGGDDSSANSAIIVPPAGSGNVYHIFTTFTSSTGNTASTVPLRHTGVTVSGTTVTVTMPTSDVMDPVLNRDWVAAESLGATSHTDCNKYWVISLDANSNEWVSILIDSDAGPIPANITRSPYGAPLKASNVYGMRISSDGRFIAHANMQAAAVNNHNLPRSDSSVDIFSFNRTSGAITYHSQITELGERPAPYGTEFSHNSEHLYFSDYPRGTIHRHTMGTSATLAQCAPIYDYRGQIGALQMGPNGKIYATKRGQSTLISIDNPNAILSNPSNAASNRADVGFQVTAQAAGGGNLAMGGRAELGLPTFTRIADDCLDGTCDRIASNVNDTIRNRFDDINKALRHCDEEQGPAAGQFCRPLDLPEMKPILSIVWGNSNCDRIESDDVETLLISVSNPYSNIVFCDVKIHKITVTNMDGTAVPILPDGTPSVELIPIGPYCFGKIESCDYVTREFVIRTRGARSGPYHINVEGICYEICIHGDMEDCFVFDVCED